MPVSGANKSLKESKDFIKSFVAVAIWIILSPFKFLLHTDWQIQVVVDVYFERWWVFLEHDSFERKTLYKER